MSPSPRSSKAALLWRRTASGRARSARRIRAGRRAGGGSRPRHAGCPLTSSLDLLAAADAVLDGHCARARSRTRARSRIIGPRRAPRRPAGRAPRPAPTLRPPPTRGRAVQSAAAWSCQARQRPCWSPTLLEDRDHALRDVAHAVGRSGCGVVKLEELALDQQPRPGDSSPAAPRRASRFGERMLGLVELARVHERGGEVGREPRAPPVGDGRQARLRARAGRSRRARSLRPSAAAAARLEALGGRAGRARPSRRRCPGARRGSDTPARGGSRRTRRARSRALLEPVGVALVERRRASPSGSRRRRRRGAAGGGSGTRPRPSSAARSGRMNSLRTSAVSVCGQPWLARGRAPGRRRVEDLALDGGRLEHASARRRRAGRAAPRAAPGSSAARATCSSSRPGASPPAPGRTAGCPRRPRRCAATRRRRARGRRAGRGSAARPARGVSGSSRSTPRQPGPPVEQLGAGHADEQDRRARRDEGDVLDQVEQRLLGPLDVVEDEHERLLARDRLDELAERPGELVGRATRPSPSSSARSGAASAVVERRQLRRSCVSTSSDGPVGDAGAVGEAAAAARPCASTREQELGRRGATCRRRRRRRPSPARSAPRPQTRSHASRSGASSRSRPTNGESKSRTGGSAETDSEPPGRRPARACPSARAARAARPSTASRASCIVAARRPGSRPAAPPARAAPPS